MLGLAYFLGPAQLLIINATFHITFALLSCAKLQYHKEIATFVVTMESVVFSNQVDTRIVKVWKEVKALVDKKNIEVVMG